MKKLFAMMLALVMVLAAVPVLAEGEETYVAWIGEQKYTTLEAAVNEAKSGDTIMLGEGKFTLYNKGADTKGKDLTFIGQGADKTGWNIGADVPDPANFGTEYNGDYSFDGAGTITFRNMTLQSGAADYLGFIRADNTIVENCTVNGKTFYWGYTSASFKNTTFNCPSGDYAIWTYSSPTMTFDTCTFNSSGKVINVYTDYDAGKHDITVNFENCTVNNTGESLKPVLNINDSNMGDFKYILNITGDNKVTGVNVDNITCSRLFGFGGKANTNNTGKTVVNIDGITVWKDGKMVSHAIDTANDKYTDGYKDNAFDIDSIGEWTLQTGTNTYTRNISRTCRYCGYSERIIETKQEEYVPPYNPTPVQPVQPVQPAPLPPQTGDMPLWYAVAQFLGLVK
mgnify:CR=1 FL=1